MFTIMVAAAVKSAIVFALAWAIAKMMRRASAAARHLVWASAAAVVIALPLFSAWMPAWHVPAPEAWRETAAVFQVTATGARLLRARPRFPWDAEPPCESVRDAGLADHRSVGLGTWHRGRPVRDAAGLRGDRSSPAISESIVAIDGVELLEAPAGSMPMATGIWKPAVFLPADATDWPGDRRRAVLAHELAHVHRGDAATQMLARTALALYWWNPLAWLAWREFLKERECAADDLVLASGVSAPDYAGHLLEIARRLAAPRMSLAMARPSQLEGRLLAILDSNVSRRSAGRRSAAGRRGVRDCGDGAACGRAGAGQSALPADLQATIRSAQSQRDPAMLEKIAKAAEDQRNFEVARTLLDAALEIRGQVSGKSSAEYGMTLLKLAKLELWQHGLLAPAALYSQAAEALRTGRRRLWR